MEMNNRELCQRVQECVSASTEWNMDSNLSLLEKILAHFDLPCTKQLFYNRDAELATLLGYLNENASEEDRKWLIDQLDANGN